MQSIQHAWDAHADPTRGLMAGCSPTKWPNNVCDPAPDIHPRPVSADTPFHPACEYPVAWLCIELLADACHVRSQGGPVCWPFAAVAIDSRSTIRRRVTQSLSCGAQIPAGEEDRAHQAAVKSLEQVRLINDLFGMTNRAVGLGRKLHTSPTKHGANRRYSGIAKGIGKEVLDIVSKMNPAQRTLNYFCTP